MNFKTLEGGPSLRLGDTVCEDSALRVSLGGEIAWLSPAQQDLLISHLIEVRGAGRIQDVLRDVFSEARV
jgi:hypothetical protein